MLSYYREGESSGIDRAILGVALSRVRSHPDHTRNGIDTIQLFGSIVGGRPRPTPQPFAGRRFLP